MFGILVSAFNLILGWLVRSVLVKFVIFFALYFVTTQFVGVISSWMPTGASLTSAFGGISAATWYFLDLFALSVGLPAVISACLTRFIIRRLPVIG